MWAREILNESSWCLSRGANVVVNYAGSKDAAEAVAKEIEGMGVKAMAVKVLLSFLFRYLFWTPRVQQLAWLYAQSVILDFPFSFLLGFLFATLSCLSNMCQRAQ